MCACARCLWIVLLGVSCVAGDKAGPSGGGRGDSTDSAVPPEDSGGAADSGNTGADSGHMGRLDIDGDGYTGEVDCDDLDPTINPGQPESCGDNTDENCNGFASGCMEGVVACGDADAIIASDLSGEPSLVPAPAGDVDGDGIDDLLIGGPQRWWYSDGSGRAFVILGGGVWPDTLASAWLTVQGAPYLDQNLGDGLSTTGDLDGDGRADIAVHGTILDEPAGEHWEVHMFMGLGPGILETADADATIAGPAGTHYLWTDPRGPADLSGDDQPDLVIGGIADDAESHMMAWVCEPPFSESRSSDGCEITVTNDEPMGGNWPTGHMVDLDGDGQNDLALGFSGHCTESGPCSEFDEAGGAVFVYDGPLRGALTSDDRDQELIGGDVGDWAGYAVAAIGDVDGDGYEDLATSANQANRISDGSSFSIGAAYIIHGPLASSASLSTADAIITGDSWYPGEKLDGPGDLTGDGVPDVLVTALIYDTNPGGPVCVSLFDGDISGTVLPSDAPVQFVSDEAQPYTFGGASGLGVGDLNDDGWPDLALSDECDDEYVSGCTSMLFLLYGLLPGGESDR